MSYLELIGNSDGLRLAYAAHKIMREFLPKLLGSAGGNWDSEDFPTNLGTDFAAEMKRIEGEEKGVRFTEQELGHSIIFAGARGLLNLVAERMLSKEEKVEILAKLALQKVLLTGIAESEQRIILGLLKRAISEEITEIQKSLREGGV